MPASWHWQGEVVCNNACILRAAAALDSPVVGELRPGTRVTAAEQVELSGGKARLHLVEPYEGWVTAKLVRPVDAGSAAAGSEAPETSSKSAGGPSRKVPGADCDEVTDLLVPEGRHLRLYLISDIHIDHKANSDWMMGCLGAREPDPQSYFDCLLLPGDITNKEDLFEQSIGVLASAFDAVFFCFGNHDIWTRGERKGDPPAADSLQKLERVHKVCQELGVYTSPVRLVQQGKKALVLLPLWSWYHSSWDVEPDLPTELTPPIKPGSRVMDFRMCKWGAEIESKPGFKFGDDRGHTSTIVAEYFAARNEAWMQAVAKVAADDSAEVITFSHFCPRIELVLEKRNCYDQQIAKVQGSDLLEKQIRRVVPQPKCHVFGHTHVGWDMVLDGLRYLHWPLGNPTERQGQTRAQNDGGFLLLRDGDQWAPQQFQHWSYHYDYLGGERVPGATDLAPWVTSGYARTYPAMVPALEEHGLIKEPDPVNGYAAYFPGGAENNDLNWWSRHYGYNFRWRLPPSKLAPNALPCEDPECLICRHMKEHEVS